MSMNERSLRENLLRTGMGFFAFSAGVTLFNVLALPIARQYHGYRAVIMLPAFVLAILAYVFAARRMAQTDDVQLERVRRVAVPVFLTALFIIQVLLGYLMQYEPAGDNHAVYEGSRILACNGNFDEFPNYELYLARFSNQWGILLFFTGMWKLFTFLGLKSIFMPQVIVQALLYIPGMFSALSIARRTRGVRAELMLLVLLTSCLPLYLAAGVVYTDTFSLPFVPIVLDLALRVIHEKDAKRQLLLAAACGLTATLGGMIKMTVVIALMAAVIVWMMTMHRVRALLCGALCGAILLMGNVAMHHAMLGGAIDRQIYEQQNMPKVHWIMMAIPSSDNPYGSYATEYGLTWSMMDEGASREEIMDSICLRMKDKIYTLRYPDRLMLAALRKNAANFGDGTFGMTEMLDDNPVRPNTVSQIVLGGGRYYALYQAITSGVFFAQLLLATLACVRDICRRNLNMASGYVAAFGMMLFLMLWEARARYFFGFVPVILLLASQVAAEKEES